MKTVVTKLRDYTSDIWVSIRRGGETYLVDPMGFFEVKQVRS